VVVKAILTRRGDTIGGWRKRFCYIENFQQTASRPSGAAAILAVLENIGGRVDDKL
jgi:hypothetical protein